MNYAFILLLSHIYMFFNKKIKLTIKIQILVQFFPINCSKCFFFNVSIRKSCAEMAFIVLNNGMKQIKIWVTFLEIKMILWLLNDIGIDQMFK